MQVCVCTQDGCLDVQETEGEPRCVGEAAPRNSWVPLEGGEGYLGDSPGARRPSPAGPRESAARPRWGRLPTGSASSHGRRRPLAGRGRGKGRRGRAGCPLPVGRSGTWQPSPVAHIGEMGAERCPRGDRKGQAGLPKHANRQTEPPCSTSHLEHHLPPGPPSLRSPFLYGSQMASESLNGDRRWHFPGWEWLFEHLLWTGMCLHPHHISHLTETQSG